MGLRLRGSSTGSEWRPPQVVDYNGPEYTRRQLFQMKVYALVVWRREERRHRVGCSWSIWAAVTS
ncbi:hypothetical protein SALBM311S_12267 [Streptomyces alboniger]